MIEALDSSFSRPTLAQAQAARAAGVGLWNVYVATRANVGLAAPWSHGDIQLVQSIFPGEPVAFCSGWDDPGALAALANAWGVRLCLDDESGIRPEGSWVQGFLDASGAGLYGNQGVFPGRHAAFYILGAYPTSGDPTDASWNSSPRPAGLCGWQWAGTHNEFGCTVDT
jgi:hypothetical protein